MHRFWHWMTRLPSVVRWSGILVLVACGGAMSDTVAPPTQARELDYWALRFVDRAINLSVAAPTNTLQLVVVPQNAAGTPLTGVTATPTFEVRSSAVEVSATGLLTARSVATRIPVIARLQIGTVTHVDTAIVSITATAPENIGTVLSIAPVAPDSAKWSYNITSNRKAIIPRNANGDPLAGLTIAYESSNDAVADVYTSVSLDPEYGIVDVGKLGGITPGIVTIRASTYAYNTRLIDSVQYVIGLPTGQILSFFERPAPDGTGVVPWFGWSDTGFNIDLGIGGQVAFVNFLGTKPAALTFEREDGGTPPLCMGDLSAIPPNGIVFCIFPGGAGTYVFRAVRGGAFGTVTVRAEGS
jgi:hypothetical protein